MDNIIINNPELKEYYENLGKMTDSELKDEWVKVTNELRNIYNINNNIHNKRTSSSVKFN